MWVCGKITPSPVIHTKASSSSNSSSCILGGKKHLHRFTNKSLETFMSLVLERTLDLCLNKEEKKQSNLESLKKAH